MYTKLEVGDDFSKSFIWGRFIQRIRPQGTNSPEKLSPSCSETISLGDDFSRGPFLLTFSIVMKNFRPIQALDESFWVRIFYSFHAGPNVLPPNYITTLESL